MDRENNRELFGSRICVEWSRGSKAEQRAAAVSLSEVSLLTSLIL